MRNVLLVILGCIDLASSVPYFRDILKGKTKPNIASWSTWTLLNAITVVAAIQSGGAINTVILAASYLLSTLIILVLAFKKGTRSYTRFDAICQTLAVVGIVIWLRVHNPTIALIFVIAISEIIAVPTLRHAYLFPNEETFSTFAIASFVALGTLCLATEISFAALAVPIDLIVGNTTLAAVIWIRRRHKQLPLKV